MTSTGPDVKADEIAHAPELKLRDSVEDHAPENVVVEKVATKPDHIRGTPRSEWTHRRKARRLNPSTSSC